MINVDPVHKKGISLRGYQRDSDRLSMNVRIARDEAADEDSSSRRRLGKDGEF